MASYGVTVLKRQDCLSVDSSIRCFELALCASHVPDKFENRSVSKSDEESKRGRFERQDDCRCVEAEGAIESKIQLLQREQSFGSKTFT